MLTFARRRRRWDLAGIRLIDDGKPQDPACSISELIRLSADHEPGTGGHPRIRGSRLPRNTALDVRKIAVLRV